MQNWIKKLFTSESVSEGHPDKLCDQISDAILDACLKEDKYSRVACEVFATSNRIIISGEVSINESNEFYINIARNVLRDIGYSKEFGLDPDTFPIEVLMNKQSEDIAMGVVKNKKIKGAGDQGIMFGFACKDTANYMPLAIQMSHDLLKRLTYLRKNSIIKGIGPDAKAQVTLDVTDPSHKKIFTVLISTQHAADKSQEELEKELKEQVIYYVADKYKLNRDFTILVNPTGRFVIGGPVGDTGLTGRKIIVDSYGGYGRHGGGAFSGKDASKVDRSAAYMARYIAKNLVHNGFADKAEIQLSYAIGEPKPISISVETFGTSTYSEQELVGIIDKNFDLTVEGIVSELELRKPVYYNLAKYGHFGREDLNVSWEKLIKIKK